MTGIRYYVPDIQYRPTEEIAYQVIRKNTRLIVWGGDKKFDQEAVLSDERYTKSYTIAYAQGCPRRVSTMVFFFR